MSAAHVKGDLAEALVSEQFGVAGGELVIGGVGVRDLAGSHGSPLYVYDAGLMQARYAALTRALTGFADVYFSIKANPNPAVAKVFVDQGAGLEIASGAEFLFALSAGCSARNILFAGPGKGEAELELAIGGGIGEIHLESFEEIATVSAIAERTGRNVDVAIRINPSAAAQGGAMRMGGKPAAFGFDEEIVGDVLEAVAQHPRLKLSGVHLFAGTQILSAAVLIDQWRYGIGLARNVAQAIGRPLQRIDLGGGLGIPYHTGDETLDLTALAEGACVLASEVSSDPLLRQAQVLIEPGRYLTGPAGMYLMRVRSVKQSRGQRFIVTDGGMHHHLAASGNLGQVIKRDYPIVAASRMDDQDLAPASIVGPLCTPLDTLGRQTPMPAVVPGDILAVLQSGAYGLSTSPVGFLSHPTPAEVLVSSGETTLIRPGGSFLTPVTGLTLPAVP